MKNLNRKRYKKIIKEFRKTEPLAQLQRKWLFFSDFKGKLHLMFVQGSVIKRAKNRYEEYHSWEYKGFNFIIEFYGLPDLFSQYNRQIELNQYIGSSRALYGKDFRYKIIPGEDLEKYIIQIFRPVINHSVYSITGKYKNSNITLNGSTER